MSGDSGKKYTGFQKRDIVFISIILKRYNTILFRYSLQENDNIILIIGMSKSPVFIRCRLLKCVQVKERFFGLCYWKSTRKKVQVGKENPLFRQSKNIPFGSDKTVLSFAVSLRLLAYRSWFKAHICSIHGLLQTHLTFVQIISHIKNLNKTVYCTLCRNRKTWSICHLYTAVHITTPQHIRWLFYIQTTRIFHLCNEHLRLHADLSADKTLLTSVKSGQQNVWPSLAWSPCRCAWGHLYQLPGGCYNTCVHLSPAALCSWSDSWSGVRYVLTQAVWAAPPVENFFFPRLFV